MADCICVRWGDGPEGCGICNETGTTPDIAGLCKRLRDNWDWPSLLMTEAADTLERQAAEIERLRGVLADALPYVVQFEDMRDGIHGAPEPNCAMQLAHEIRAALTGEDT